MVVLTMTCILALTAEAATFTDDFSAGINPAHYTVTAGAYTIDGTQGDVRMSKPYGPGAWAQLFFNHDVYGDFDISVDYRDAVLAGNHNQIQLNLSFGGQYIVDRRENWEGSRYSVWIDPPANIYGATGTADTAGKLRVTRIGSTITCYANDTQIYQGDFNSSPVTDLWLSLQNNGTEDAISVTFDNFSITADGIDCNPSGMVSWWKAENNAVDSVGTSNGTLQNGTTYAAGQVGQAFSLDGVDDYIELPAGFADFTSGFTIGLWANPTASGNWARFLELGNGSQANNILFLRRLTTNQLAFQVYNGDTLTGTAYAENAITNDEWHYYAATMDATGHVQLYKDGLPLVMAADSSSVTVPQNVTRSINTIGKSSWGDPYYTGMIDEVEIFNRALTAGEIATIYNSGATGVCGIDSTPNAFSFTAQTGMPITTTIVSNPITVTGIIYPVAISISTNGEYSKSTDGGSTWGEWISAEGTVGVNDQIKVRQTSSASNSILSTATLTIGGVNGAFDVTTAAPGDPNASGLVAWWKAEGNVYDSVSGNHGTLQAGTTYATGQVGQAFSFDGVDDYVNVPYSLSLELQESITIVAWINSSNNSINRAIAGKAGGYQIFIEAGGHLDLGFYNGTWTHLQSSVTIPENEWVYVAGTFNSTDGTMQLYINGIPDTSLVTAQRMSTNANGLKIGGFGSDGAPFSGIIDEVKIFNLALSALEISTLAGTKPDAFSFTAQTSMPLSTSITSNPISVTGTSSPAAISITNGEYSISTDGGGTWSAYSSTIPATVSLNDQVQVRQTSSPSNSTLTTANLTIGGVSGTFDVTTAASGDPNAIGLVSWWKAENNVYDSVGTNNGTLQNGATYAAGKVGQSFSLDGTNTYVEIPHDASLSVDPSSPMSFETWLYRTSTSGTQHIFSKRTDCSYFNYQLALDSLGHNGLCFGGNATQNCTTGGTSDLPLNTWTHIAGTSDGSTLKLFINGKLAATAAGKIGAENTAPLKIGAAGTCGTYLFGGLIDEVEFFNRALSDLEISTLAGTKPDVFSFTDQTNVAPSTVATSTLDITVTGITNAAAISIAGCTGTNCEYKINGNDWASTAGTVNNGDTVSVRQTSSAGYSTQTDLVLNIGGVTDTFIVTTMAIPQHTLTVSKAGTGAGDVTGGGTYNQGTTQQITATASTGSTFTGWSGDCAGTASPLDVLIDGNKTCTATFTLITHTLTVNKAGTGAVDVTGGGTYNQGTTQQITATASTGSTFTGWSGSCAGTTSPLDVLIDGNKTCIATFTLNTYTLTINKTGLGTVTSLPTGINCGTDCSESYNNGDEVTLTAIPANGNIFIGWSNDGCTGQEDCIITMNDYKEISVFSKRNSPGRCSCQLSPSEFNKRESYLTTIYHGRSE